MGINKKYYLIWCFIFSIENYSVYMAVSDNVDKHSARYKWVDYKTSRAINTIVALHGSLWTVHVNKLEQGYCQRVMVWQIAVELRWVEIKREQ